ncbi:BNR/Asp-box repeat protein [Aquimarina brevivitae]|uniref:BNR/Asp-box repeat protein n=2 Tax=Aquimarina brevivitae TaxID=323412 RepID=A0A4Q7P0S0_9FLAO|nr:BNR/Asp-box repeat protein [Aquimarina brevivitae]
MRFLFGLMCLFTFLSNAQLSSEDGFVMFKFKMNDRNIDGRVRDWSYLNLKNVTTGKKHTIYPEKHYAFNKTQLFAGELPAGDYEMLEISAYIHPQTHTIAIPKGSMSFQVKPQQLTYLGNIIEMPISASYSFFKGYNEKIIFGIDTPQPDEASIVVNGLFPEKKSLLEKPFIGWLENEGTAKKQKVFNLIKKYIPEGWLAPYELSNGQLVFATLLGSIRLVDIEKREGTLIQTGLNDPITSFVELKNGTWLAGSEFGELIYSTNQGEEWQSPKHQLPFGTVSGIYQYTNEDIYVVVSNSDRVKLLKGSLDEEWEVLLDEEAIILPHSSDLLTSFKHSHLVKNQLFLLMKDNLLVYDMDTGKAEKALLPGKGKKKVVTLFQVSTAGKVRVVRTNRSSFLKGFYATDDLGKNWEELETQITRRTIGWFYDENKGLRMLFKPFAKNFYIESTVDDGITWNEEEVSIDKSWTMGGAFPDNFFKLNKNDYLMLYNDYKLSMISKDGGKTWEQLTITEKQP